MATSGTTLFTLSFTDVAEDAFERAGREMHSGYDLRTARRSMNLLTLEWANRGLNLWTIEEGAVTLVQGDGDYTLPADTIDLIECVLRTDEGDAAKQKDIVIQRIGVSVYASIPNKVQTGQPVQYYVDRQRDAPVIKVWPVPRDNTYKLRYWRMRRMQDAGWSAENPDVPFRFLPALVSGLAFYIAQKIPEGRANVAVLQTEYERQFGLASQEDRQRVPFRVVPRIGRVGR